MSEDYLSELPEEKVAAWYRRLADRIALERINGTEPLSATFLRVWLDNRDPQFTYRFEAPFHLRQFKQVRSELLFHRDVFLSKQKARLTGGSSRWAGVLPRIQGLPGYEKWDFARRQIEVKYESLVTVGSNLVEITRIAVSGSTEERDLFTSLHGFQLQSSARLAGTAAAGSTNIRIQFLSWTCCVRDQYHFNDEKRLSVPNPDFGSKASDAVRPQDRSLVVFHKNAERLEKKNLAAPYNVESSPWEIHDPEITAPEDVDASRKLAA